MGLLCPAKLAWEGWDEEINLVKEERIKWHNRRGRVSLVGILSQKLTKQTRPHRKVK